MLAATRFDAGDAAAIDPVERESSRPDFVALIYPGPWPDLEFVPDTPPLFLLCGGDDRPDVVTGITSIYLHARERGIPAELHIYDHVGHGFGVRASNTGPVAGLAAAIRRLAGGREVSGETLALSRRERGTCTPAGCR